MQPDTIIVLLIVIIVVIVIIILRKKSSDNLSELGDEIEESENMEFDINEGGNFQVPDPTQDILGNWLNSEAQKIGVTSDIILAIEYLENNDYKKAKSISAKVVAKAPYNWFAHNILVIALRKLGEFSRATELANKAALIPFPENLSHEEAKVFLRVRELIARFGKEVYLGVNPEALACANLGAELCNAGKVTEGEKCFCEAIRIDGNCELAHFNLGTSAYDRNDFRLASDCMKKVIEINPKNQKARALLEKLGN